jgi:hypothetical protein
MWKISSRGKAGMNRRKQRERRKPDGGREQKPAK